MNLAGFVLPFVAPGLSPIEESEAERVLALALASAGVTVERPSPERRATSRFCAPQLVDVTVAHLSIDELGLPRFADLPTTFAWGVDESWSERSSALENDHWVDRLPFRRLGGGADALRLHVAADGRTAVGSIEVSRHVAADGREARQILSARAGCAILPTDAYPVDLGTEPTTLSFLFDLHGGVNPSGLPLVLETDGFPFELLPIELASYDPAVRLEGGPVLFGDAIDEPAVVALTSRAGSFTAFDLARREPCVAVEQLEATPDSILLAVRETAAASEPHACQSVLLYARVADDPDPWNVRLPFEHQRLEPGRDGLAARFHGLFLPGETVEVYRSPAGRLRLSHPERLPTSATMFQAVGYRRCKTVRIPHEEPFTLDLEVDGQAVRISGALEPRLEERKPHWLRTVQ